MRCIYLSRYRNALHRRQILNKEAKLVAGLHNRPEDRLRNIAQIGLTQHQRGKAKEFHARTVVVAFGRAFHQVVLGEKLQQPVNRARRQTETLRQLFKGKVVGFRKTLQKANHPRYGTPALSFVVQCALPGLRRTLYTSFQLGC